MIHILLAILKIIGISILSILGLIILAVLAGLFVPVRYKAVIAYNEKANGWARVSWLFRILSFKLLVNDNAVSYQVRIFGIRLNLGKEKKKKKRHRQKRQKRGARQERKLDQAMSEAESTAEEQEGFVSVSEEPAEQIILELEHLEQETVSVLKSSVKEEEAAIPEKKSLFEKLRNKMESIWRKLKNIKYTFSAFCDRIKEIWQKASSFFAMLGEEETQESIALLKREGLKVWRHCRPRRLEGHVEYGTDDPVLTAQILVGLAAFYAVYGRHIQIIPDFEQTRLEADLYLRGRIRSFPIVVSAIRIYSDKNIKKLIKRRLN